MKRLRLKQVASWVLGCSSALCVPIRLIRHEWIDAFGQLGCAIIFLAWALRYGQAIRIGRVLGDRLARTFSAHDGKVAP